MADYKTINYPVTPAEKGQQVMDDSISVVIASDQTPIDVNATLVDPSVGTNGATAPTSSGLAGTVDTSTGNLEPLNSHDVSGTQYLYVDGSQFTQPISVATLPLPNNAATETTLTTVSNTLGTIDDKINTAQYQSSILVNANNDVFGSPVVASKYNQIEIDFNTAPSGSVITNTTASGGSITQTAGHSVYTANTTTTSQAKSVTVQSLTYRPGNEAYAMFTASFTNAIVTNCYQRIGLYDANNGFYIGFEGRFFGVTKRTGGVDTYVQQSSFNVDTLSGVSGSKFTRNGTPEALVYGYSNLFRIRFGWLGSAAVMFEVMSPDGEWVLFHVIKQPNTSLVPSLTNPNLPMTIDVNKNGDGSGVSLTMSTACWAAGTTSSYSKITDTLTDNSLAGLNRSVITGVTTGGGGGYVNVKVNPSGALTADVTGTVAATQSGTWDINNISGTVSLPTGAATSAKQPALGSAGTASSDVITVQGIAGMTAVQVDGSGVTQPVSGTVTANAGTGNFTVVQATAANLNATVTGTVSATQSGTWDINNISGTVSLPTGASTESTLSAMSGKLPSTLGQTTMANSLAVTVASDQSAIKMAQTNSKGEFVRNDYTSTSVTTSAYTQLIASTSADYSAVEIFDSSGQTLKLAIGGSGSEVDQFLIFPGGNGRIPYTVASGSRISIRAVSGNATSGEIDINFYV